MSRYRDPQLQMSENYPYLLFDIYLLQILIMLMLNTHFVPDISDLFDRQLKKVKNDNSRDQHDKG